VMYTAFIVLCVIPHLLGIHLSNAQFYQPVCVERCETQWRECILKGVVVILISLIVCTVTYNYCRESCKLEEIIVPS
ncbi:hypothetical protein CRM22_010408, partial [Opisthorchis felineus]